MDKHDTEPKPGKKFLFGKRGLKKGKFRPTDLFFWLFIVLLLIPSTRSIIMGGVSKLRTAIFTPALKTSDGPVLDAISWNWNLQELEGETISLADFKGDVILVNNWATWCPPCRAEMPSLEKLFQGYGDKITMILASQEENQTVQEYIDKKGYTFPVYIVKSGIPEAFYSKSIPSTFIVDKNGQVVYQRTGAFDWNNRKVRKFLDKLLANQSLDD
jgi:thiol-disulfide isomerase/thioredoxin